MYYVLCTPLQGWRGPMLNQLRLQKSLQSNVSMELLHTTTTIKMIATATTITTTANTKATIGSS